MGFNSAFKGLREDCFGLELLKWIIISVCNFQIVKFKQFSNECCFSANRSK